MHRSFTEELWKSITPIFEAILRHPFIQGLSDGSLPEERFRYYVVQDALFLQDFARSLALTAAKSPRDSWFQMFAQHAKETLEAELALHESFFRDWNLTLEQVYAHPQSPSTLAYTSYLLRVAYATPFAEVVGAVLPCYWIYWEVGKVLESQGSPNPLYQRWIDLYASEQYASSVRPAIAVMDELSFALTDSQREAVRQHFVVTSRYEWMFWDAAWRLETWLPEEAGGKSTR